MCDLEPLSTEVCGVDSFGLSIVAREVVVGARSVADRRSNIWRAKLSPFVVCSNHRTTAGGGGGGRRGGGVTINILFFVFVSFFLPCRLVLLRIFWQHCG